MFTEVYVNSPQDAESKRPHELSSRWYPKCAYICGRETRLFGSLRQRPPLSNTVDLIRQNERTRPSGLAALMNITPVRDSPCLPGLRSEWGQASCSRRTLRRETILSRVWHYLWSGRCCSSLALRQESLAADLYPDRSGFPPAAASICIFEASHGSASPGGVGLLRPPIAWVWLAARLLRATLLGQLDRRSPKQATARNHIERVRRVRSVDVEQAFVLTRLIAVLQLFRDVVAFKEVAILNGSARYEEARRSGSCNLIPADAHLSELRSHYRSIALMIHGQIPDFDQIVDSLRRPEQQINHLADENG